MNTSAPSAMSPRKPLGFAIPGYAAAAGKKGHALGVSYRFTSEAARKAVQKRGELKRDAAGRFIRAAETDTPQA